MKRLLLCNFLLMKRSLKKLSFIFLLLSIPVLCFILKDNISVKNSSSVRAGIYLENDSELAVKISSELLSDYESVSFEMCSDLETMKKYVTTGKYECAYVFLEDFDKNLLKNDTKDLVIIYASPGTIASALTNEYVFAAIYKEYCFYRLADYIANNEGLSGKKLSNFMEGLRALYDDYLSGDRTFSFEYINPKEGVLDGTSLFTSFKLTSVKGLIALFVMFAAFMGALNLYKDNHTGVFFAFNGVLKVFAKMSEIFTMTFIAGLSGLVAVYLCNLSDGFLIEILRMLVYTVICTVYFYVIYMVTLNQYIFAALIPMLVLGSIIFCPIFIDFSEFIPFVKYMSWVFAPKYYFLF